MTDVIWREWVESALESKTSLLHWLKANNSVWTSIDAAAEAAAKSIESGNKIIFAGNGGSFADAQHLAAEFTGRMGVERPPLAAIALGTNSSSMSAIGNDYSFDDIFLREFVALASTRDFLFLISTSGNSRNLIAVASSIADKQINHLGLLGKDGGKLAEILPKRLIVPSNITERIQEVQIFLGHAFCRKVELNLGFLN